MFTHSGLQANSLRSEWRSMLIKEFENRDDYLAFVNDPINRKRIRRVYLYWYEGRGTRMTKILPGKHADAYWENLSLDERIRQALNIPEALREALQRDYKENGGMSEVVGRPEDAVIVVEYDEKA